MHPMYDPMRVEADRYAFYLQAYARIHPTCAYHLTSLHRGDLDTALPETTTRRRLITTLRNLPCPPRLPRPRADPRCRAA